MTITAQILNQAALQKINEGGSNKLAEISAIFIADRLWAPKAEKPKVSCDIECVELIRWNFTIEMPGQEAKKVGVEMTRQMLTCLDEPLTRFLEREVKKEMGLS